MSKLTSLDVFWITSWLLLSHLQWEEEREREKKKKTTENQKCALPQSLAASTLDALWPFTLCPSMYRLCKGTAARISVWFPTQLFIVTCCVKVNLFPQPASLTGWQQMPLISSSDRQLVTTQNRNYNASAHACRSSPHPFPVSTLVFHSPASPLLFPPLHRAGWITCHRNNPQSLLLPIVLLSCADAPLWTKEPPIHRAFLPSLSLHSRLISSIQWPWLLCFCNSQFDFSLQWRLDQCLHWEDAWQSERSSMGASTYRMFYFLKPCMWFHIWYYR